MKILVVSPKNKTVFNFRGDLVKDMIAKGNEVYVTGPNRDFVEDIYALGIKEFIEVPLVKDNTSIKGDLKYLFRLVKVMKKVKPDLVFSYTIKPVIYGSISAKLAGVKKVYPMVTGLGRVYTSESFKTKVIKLITKMLYKTAFRCCNKVIFQNKDDINEFVRGGYLPKTKVAKVNGSGVNMERFSRTPLPETPVFLMVSRIIKEKGVLEYCKAAREVKKTHPEARFILLGGFDNSIGALQPGDIQPYIDDGSIEYPGEVKDPVEFYHKCSVFVLPSYYREGLPRTTLEAMACGRAIITTDWPGCREPIDDGINGYLVPVENSEKLADRMMELCSYDKICKIADNAYNSCKKKYDVKLVNLEMQKYIGY